jgi:aldehyde dehydrogenase (NAD+)
LVFLRNGESLQEGYGEVGDDWYLIFAVGLSRQLRADNAFWTSGHRMYEQYHPMGTVGIIYFQLSGSRLGLNTMWQVCGDVCVWKPSKKNTIVWELPVRTLLRR